MTPLLSDAQFNSVALIIIAVIGATSAILSARWSRSAKNDSAEAKENSAHALHEVRTNGGMSDPKPNLNDHVKYQTTMTEWLVREVQSIGGTVAHIGTTLDEHITHSTVMDQALAEVYLKVQPNAINWPEEDLPQPPPD